MQYMSQREVVSMAAITCMYRVRFPIQKRWNYSITSLLTLQGHAHKSCLSTKRYVFSGCVICVQSVHFPPTSFRKGEDWGVPNPRQGRSPAPPCANGSPRLASPLHEITQSGRFSTCIRDDGFTQRWIERGNPGDPGSFVETGQRGQEPVGQFAIDNQAALGRHGGKEQRIGLQVVEKFVREADLEDGCLLSVDGFDVDSFLRESVCAQRGARGRDPAKGKFCIE